MAVLAYSLPRKGRALVHVNLPVILDILVFAAQIGNKCQYPFHLMVQGPGDIILVVQGVRSHGNPNLLKTAQAVNGSGLLAHPLQSRHHYPHQQRNNGNHNQQFD